jgi:uncharacterized protein YbcC (UPF0753/DUF2309 family)
MQEPTEMSTKSNDPEHVIAALDHAAHYLPDQGPIGVFVHHNTLHAFGHLTFHEAIAQASAHFGAEPYLSEDAFRQHHARGRITDQDIDAALAASCPDDEMVIALPGWTLRRHELRRLAMLHAMHAETPEGLRYLLQEASLDTRLGSDVPAEAAARLIEEGRRHVRALLDRGSDDEGVTALAAALAGPGEEPAAARARLASIAHTRLKRRALRQAIERDPEAFAVRALWARCQALTHAMASPTPPVQQGFRLGHDGTHRDLLLRLTGEDIGTLVNPEMLRLASAYLDLGMAYWPMPDRAHGFYAAVCALVAGSPKPAAKWQRSAAAELRERARRGDRAVDVLVEALTDLGVPDDVLEPYFTKLLLMQLGWAGMMSRLERHPEDRPPGTPPASLADYVAVRLVFERAAIRHVARTSLGWHGPLAELVDRFGRDVRVEAPAPGDHDRAYRLFRLAAVAGLSALGAAELGVAGAGALLSELVTFDELARRRTFQEAYERHYRHQILDALAAHRQHVRLDERVDQPRFQVIMCIDDRAESLRRHLEELEPRVETFGAAGFFGVAVDFRGLDDERHVALCPVVLTPSHEVEEHPHDDDLPMYHRRVARRRLWARLMHTLSVGSRSLFRGQILTALGSAAAIPMTSRVLFPRASGRLRQQLTESLLPRPRTMLRSAREADAATERSERGKLRGFSVSEKVDRSLAQLQSIGLVERFAPLIVVLGHGSTSQNNPHASAYDCGACGGRRGGPNARLFAKMLNRSEVRAALRARGIDIPETTWFIGGMHDTASDAITLYDTDRVPAHATEALAELRRLFDEARAHDAHERCRRFESAPSNPTPEQALRHVEARAEHLAEPRSECGHATNAICIVGRRSLTRGLFLDRRAFLVSYEPTCDPDASILEHTLAAVGPVGAGINLEYYFSHVDNQRYGCGTKLPHNVTSLLGVMNGHASDLRTGLPWQMVEIHEPVRLLTIVEATPEKLMAVTERQPVVRELVVNRWIQLVSVDPVTGAMKVFGDGGFVPYTPAVTPLPVVSSSADWYRGHIEHLAPARIVPRQKAVVRATP